MVIAAEADGQVAYSLLTISVPDLPAVTSWISVGSFDFGIKDVWGTAPDNVFAVGGAYERADLLHYDGVSWRSIDSGINRALSGVWAAAPNAVVATGATGSWLYDGESWSPTESGTELELFQMLFQIWGTPYGDVFVVSRTGMVLRGVR